MRNSFNIQLFIRIFGIILTSSLFSISIYNKFSIAIPIITCLILVWQIIKFISHLNKTNKQINFFFEAILNDDFSSIYPLKRKSKILEDLNDNLKKVNEKMKDAFATNAKQEQYFQALIEHIGTGILTFNDNGFIIHANSSFKKLLNFEHLSHIKQLKAKNDGLYQTIVNIQHKEQRIIKLHSLKEDKSKLLLKAIDFHNEKEKLKLITAQDINKELNENELDSWMKLIRVLTHEIMNSIAPITSLSETLSTLYSKNGIPISKSEITDKTIETTIRGLDVIQEQGIGLMHFVESYRSLMRLPKPKKEEFEILEFLKNCPIISQNNNTSIKIEYDDKNKQLCLNADKEQLSQIINNLIKNALQATEDCTAPAINIYYGVNEEDQKFISIKDNGRGIPEDLLEEIFIPFFTTKNGGSGIGLSLSRQIMRLHGGVIDVKNNPDTGVTFTLTF